MVSGMKVNVRTALQNLFRSPSVSTALVPFIGYNQAAEVALFMKNNNVDIFEANKALQLLDTNQLKEILSAQNLLKEGFSINDIIP
jgi:aspartate ammonia-lyase